MEMEWRNRHLGAAGEELVVRYERAKLAAAGKSRLADRVEHVAQTQGDGLGYDILSFTPRGEEHFIEVKTTRLGAATPFYVTPSEVSFSTENVERYSLYRVYAFDTDPRIFTLGGPLAATCTLETAQYVALPRPT